MNWSWIVPKPDFQTSPPENTYSRSKGLLFAPCLIGFPSLPSLSFLRGESPSRVLELGVWAFSSVSFALRIGGGHGVKARRREPTHLHICSLLEKSGTFRRPQEFSVFTAVKQQDAHGSGSLFYFGSRHQRQGRKRGFGMTGHRSDDRNGKTSPHVESSAPPHRSAA